MRLAREGFTVFAAVRKEKDLQALQAERMSGLVPVILDVTKEETISHAFRTVSEAVGSAGLAGLVNNAGIGVTSPMEVVPISELRRQYEVNVVGQVAVIQAFLPLIRTARGRIINIGSVGGKLAIPFGGPLCSSKSAFELINDALRMELRPWGIHVVLVAPGSIRTPAVKKLVGDSEIMIETFSTEGRSRYVAQYRAFVQAFLKMEEDGVDAEVMAATVYHALTVPTPRTRYPVGPKSKLLPFLGAVLPARLMDTIRLRLFHVQQTTAGSIGA
jgi:NAD(P)-dependent dehydrogenase (short-subunit alcohol dehydrogenase family)